MKTSAVIVSRNDGYGGYQLKRFHLSLMSLLSNFDEVIVVDWNSKDRTLVEVHNDAFGFNREMNEHRFSKLKEIVVTPAQIAKQWPHVSHLALVEVLARNIGIRAATGDWILSTNPDCIITKQLPVDKLDRQTMYTCPRRDIDTQIFLQFDDWNTLIDIVTNTGRFHPSKPPASPECPHYGDTWSLVVCCGDFQFAHKDVWHGIRGFEEHFADKHGCGIDSNVMRKSKDLFNTAAIENQNLLFHLNHDKNPEVALPMNDQKEMIHQFDKTTNSEDWGVLKP